MSDSNNIEHISVDALSELLQHAGYRVTRSEQGGVVQLLSASQGIGFALRPGNRVQDDQYLDFTLSCALRVQGELPQALVNDWNIAKRFARLSQQGEFLVLEQDVIVAGGITHAYLRASCEVWDRLLQEFILFLRQYISNQAETAVGAELNAQAESTADTETEAAE